MFHFCFLSKSDTNDVIGHGMPNVSDNVDMHEETDVSDGKGGEKPLFFIDKKAAKLPVSRPFRHSSRLLRFSRYDKHACILK